ncbi:PREDICTED: protein TIC 40, chloroplastic-like [Lupinus angustifolius]|uniref:protein TIC 40, chloroplastic-like n=1 Tax=Lupinus angustifolius TaxID=3871 RepID=UPI00092E5F93|nr:PREDICTED: protein TIC 40, chloroplastic-like [Lupinus angustifolius]
MTIDAHVPTSRSEATPTTYVKDEEEVRNEPKRIAFVDVSPHETVQKSPFESFKDDASSSFKEARVTEEASQNGAPLNQGFGNATGSQSIGKSPLSVDALEKMMEDPTVQKKMKAKRRNATIIVMEITSTVMLAKMEESLMKIHV